jgi:hypothetical protein
MLICFAEIFFFCQLSFSGMTNPQPFATHEILERFQSFKPPFLLDLKLFFLIFLEVTLFSVVVRLTGWHGEVKEHVRMQIIIFGGHVRAQLIIDSFSGKMQRLLYFTSAQFQKREGDE